jgi:hypothetical protein
MTLTLTLLALTLAISFGVMLVNILSAPEGYENETGFHVTKVADQSFSITLSGNQLKAVPALAKVAVHDEAA